MYKKDITYTDFNGNEVTETFYFNFTQAELAEMELTHPGGLSQHIQNIIDSQDQASIIKEFKEIIMLSYGEKDPTGRTFIKDRAKAEAFSHSEAYSVLFMELATETDAATEFINGIIPKIPSEKVPDKPELKPAAE